MLWLTDILISDILNNNTIDTTNFFFLCNLLRRGDCEYYNITFIEIATNIIFIVHQSQLSIFTSTIVKNIMKFILSLWKNTQMVLSIVYAWKTNWTFLKSLDNGLHLPKPLDGFCILPFYFSLFLIFCIFFLIIVKIL